MMKKIALFILSLSVLQNFCLAEEQIKFTFPDPGWHFINSPKGFENKQCFVPNNQTSENYTEILYFYKRKIQTTGITPSVILQKQLGKDRNNYKDIVPQYVKHDSEDSMAVWCSKLYNICSVERAFQGKEGIIFAIYTNKMPHYSQNMFGKWTNLLFGAELYENDNSKNEPLKENQTVVKL